MPFIGVDTEAYEEMLAELEPEDLPPRAAADRPSGEFEYQAVSGRFEMGKLSPVAWLMLETLVAAGATIFRVRYDGGYDEGFAYPVELVFEDEARDPGKVLAELATPELIGRIRGEAGRDSMWGNATELYANATPVQAATYALDELATELATQLLGGGFGTGEYELYGAFTADLATGELVDDPNATKPEQMG